MAPPAGAAVLNLRFGVDVGLPVFVVQFAITFWLMIAKHELGNLAAAAVRGERQVTEIRLAPFGAAVAVQHPAGRARTVTDQFWISLGGPLAQLG